MTWNWLHDKIKFFVKLNTEDIVYWNEKLVKFLLTKNCNKTASFLLNFV